MQNDVKKLIRTELISLGAPDWSVFYEAICLIRYFSGESCERHGNVLFYLHFSGRYNIIMMLSTQPYRLLRGTACMPHHFEFEAESGFIRRPASSLAKMKEWQ